MALKAGGGIMYNSYRPTLSNILFVNNTAKYGKNIASYPIKIKHGNATSTRIVVNDIVSGQASVNFEFSLLDYDDQVMTLDSVSKIVLNPINASASIRGKSLENMEQGALVFNNAIFVSKPGSSNVEYSVISDAIDMSIAKAIYGTDYALPKIVVNFRYCKPGEYITQDQCQACREGSFTFQWNSTQCLN